jgi:hypothetical protein
MWPNNFDDRLLEWRSLRTRVQNLSLLDMLVEVDTWWQQAPLCLHYLHMDDYENWPEPWTLLADNLYCDLAKCLGIVYTILLLDRDDIITLVINETDNYFLIEVNNEHVLNYYPREVVTKDSIHDYDIRCSVNIDKNFINW